MMPGTTDSAPGPPVLAPVPAERSAGHV